MNNYKNIKNIKKIIKKYIVKRIQNSKKEQGGFDENAVLTPPKT